jgi:hypothetical protein
MRPIDAGACAIDVDGDGQVDLFSGDILFINRGSGKRWSRHKVGKFGYGCHDMVTVDIDQNGKMDILVHTYRNENGVGGTAWYEAPDDPTQEWTRHSIIDLKDFRYHCGIHPKGVADLDGDGDLDVATGKYWCENKNGVATEWVLHENPLLGGPDQRFGWAVKTFCVDLDGNGDNDIVQTEADHSSSDLVWLENDGTGRFTKHVITEDSGHDLHTLWVYDADPDGDYDIFTGSGVLTSNSSVRSVFPFENTAGRKQAKRVFLGTARHLDGSRVSQRYRRRRRRRWGYRLCRQELVGKSAYRKGLHLSGE